VRPRNQRQRHLGLHARQPGRPRHSLRAGPRRAATVLATDPTMVHLAQLWIRDRPVLDPAGLAMARLSDDAIPSMQARGQLSRPPYPQPLPRLPAGRRSALRLPQPSLGGPVPCPTATVRAAKRGSRPPLPRERVHPQPGARRTDPRRPRGRGHPRAHHRPGWGRISAPYRYLLVLTGIVAGRLSHDPTLVCRALPLPVDELVP